MDESVNNSIPQESVSENTSPADTVSADMDDDWGDIDFSDLEVLDADNKNDSGEEGDKGGEPEADQQEGDPEAESEESTDNKEEQEEKPAEADQPLVELKHLGNIVRVKPDELQALAQMGLDYQRIREDRDNARAEVSRLKELESFLQELAAPNNMSVDDLIDNTRAQVIADRDGVDKKTALERVRLDRERKAFEAQKGNADKQQQEKAKEEAKRQNNFLRFSKEYPNVNPTDIPKEVWDSFANGEDLVTAYARHEANSLRAEVESLKEKVAVAEKNAENKERSTGSQTTAGNSSEMDEFDRAWYDGT